MSRRNAEELNLVRLRALIKLNWPLRHDPATRQEIREVIKFVHMVEYIHGYMDERG